MPGNLGCRQPGQSDRGMPSDASQGESRLHEWRGALSENEEHSQTPDSRNLSRLRADCGECFGLCCVALYFSASEGFPTDKEPGQACPNLQPDFRCCVHESLKQRGLKGCLAFDCFGAGQQVAQVSFGGRDWRKVPESATQMFEVFLIMRQFHEMLWYLTEALALQPARRIHGSLSFMLDQTEDLTRLGPYALQGLDVAAQRVEVNALLLEASERVRAEARRGQRAHSGRRRTLGPAADLAAADLRRIDLRGANLRGACLIAADLRGVDLSGADLIGADFRDTDIRGADLSRSIFVTQAQVNAAAGCGSTTLPWFLNRPTHWDISNN
jgi:hypothetical protein